MLVDEIKIKLTGGSGGRGAVAFSKVRLVFGPNGGDGGRGADVYFEGVADINALAAYVSKKEIEAQNGENGRGSYVDGSRGKELVIKIPTGTTITKLDTNYVQEMTEVGQRILAVGGGLGGRGNFKFRSSTNTTPKEFEHGKPGDVATFKLELKLIADVGLIGLPNVGKSSLLNELTKAKSRVANHAFTTLEPHLGSYYGLLIADIPGLIEGASEGKGLGFKFLKHIERTKTLFHLVAADSEDPVADYKVVRKELENFNPALAHKDEHVFLTKCDEVTESKQKEAIAAFKKAGVKNVTPISILEPESLEKVKKILNGMKK